MSTSPLPDPAVADLVADAVGRLTTALRTRDIRSAVACFAPHGVVFGDDTGERAQGREELELFFSEIVEEPYTLGWQVDEVWGRRSGHVVWFVADVLVVLEYDEGLRESLPFRLSGVLRRGRRGWAFELFNGTQPASAGDLRIGA